MKIVPAQVLIPLYQFDNIVDEIAAIARTCYRSEDDTKKTPAEMVQLLISNGHGEMFNHHHLRVKVTTTIGVAREILTHKIGVARAVESTRWCNYGSDRFNNEIALLDPKALMLTQAQYNHWKGGMYNAEYYYLNMLKAGCKPQQARDVLPLGTACTQVLTYSLTAWANFFEKRCAPAAHPQMREIALPIMEVFANRLPLIYDHYGTTDVPHAQVVWTDNLFKPLEVQP